MIGIPMLYYRSTEPSLIMHKIVNVSLSHTKKGNKNVSRIFFMQ